MLSRRDRKRARRGAAMVEFAVMLPLAVLLLLGAVELGRGVMVLHALQEAAQAGCRVYSARDTTEQQMEDMIEEAMARAGIANYNIELEPSSKAAMQTHMQPVTVSLSVGYSQVAWLPPNFLAGATIDAACTMPADVE